jgi:CubicO group peptidase (beta-lactamase class C family)
MASIEGSVAPGFEAVREAFERNFTERDEIGAAVAVYWRGRKVADLWGGKRMPGRPDPWEEHTMAVVFSTTKGLAAMALAVAHARGWLDYKQPVSAYWPEFAQQGKAEITVRQLLDHRAGLVLLDQDLHIDELHDLDRVGAILARQKPAWAPGTAHGYHSISMGMYVQELVRRADPKARTLGQLFHEEIALPLDLDCFIGLPDEIPGDRLATLQMLSPLGAIAAWRSVPAPTLLRFLWPWSLLRRSLLTFGDVDWNDRRALAVEIPAGNAVTTARAIARAYSVFACGGEELGVDSSTMAEIVDGGRGQETDRVLGQQTRYSAGFLRPCQDCRFGSSERAFGAPGAGGSFGFADPDEQIGYAYVMNRMGYYLFDDPREKTLRDALYASIRGH